LSYLLLKHLHVTCVVLSALGFLFRGIWMLQDSARLQQRWVQIVPHVIDSLLLISALSMAVLTSQYPFVHDWLTAKLAGLLVYIFLGSVALKRGRTKKIRAMALAGALLSLTYIVSAALTRQVLPYWG